MKIWLIFNYFQILFSLKYFQNVLIEENSKYFQSNYERKIFLEKFPSNSFKDSFDFSSTSKNENNNENNNQFGKSVDIYKNYMIVGSPFDSSYGQQAGTAHIFQLTDNKKGWKYDTILYTNDTKEYDYFGWDVSISTGVVAIGAWQHDDNNYENNGAVYFFEHLRQNNKMNWKLKTKITGQNNHEYFGTSVAFSRNGEYILVGSAGTVGYSSDTTTIGLVYVIVKSSWLNQWMIQTTLRPVDIGIYDYYGVSIAADNHVTVMGAYGHNQDSSGAAYVYSYQDSDFSQWYIEARLIASDASQDDYFGKSVAVYDRTVIVGATGDDDCGISSGSAYVFRSIAGSKWTQYQKLLPPDNSAYDFFGTSLDIYQDHIVIGADGNDGTDQTQSRTGVVFYFTREYYYNDDDDYSYYYYNDDNNNEDNNGDNYYEYWFMDMTLYASDKTSHDLYGSSVALYEDSILIGAEGGDGYTENSGVCYVYTKTPSYVLEYFSNKNNSWNLWSILGMMAFFIILIGGIIFISKKFNILNLVKQYHDKLFHKSSKVNNYNPYLDDSITNSTTPLTTPPLHIQINAHGPKTQNTLPTSSRPSIPSIPSIPSPISTPSISEPLSLESEKSNESIQTFEQNIQSQYTTNSDIEILNNKEEYNNSSEELKITEQTPEMENISTENSSSLNNLQSNNQQNYFSDNNDDNDNDVIVVESQVDSNLNV